MARDEVIAYGAWQPPTNEVKSDPPPGTFGFIRATLHANSDGKIEVKDQKLLRKLPSQKYYLLGHHYITSNELGAFFLALDTNALIEWYSNGNQPLKTLDLVPPTFRNIPKLPIATGPRNSNVAFRAVEDATMITGLYGKGKYLYLLTREPEPTNHARTEWKIFKIDPSRNLLVGGVVLPTAAHHLTVATSPDAWYFFEKSSVDPEGNETVTRLLEIPASWIEDPNASPLSPQARRPVSCSEGHQSALGVRRELSLTAR